MGKVLTKHFKECVFFVFCISVFNLEAQGTKYVSFPMMNQEIRHTLQEHSRQVTIHQNQTKNTASENINKSKWKKYREIKEKVQKRLSIISFALQAIPTGYKLTQDIRKIERLQASLYEELKDAPYLLKSIFQAQITFVDDLQMTVRFIAGVVLSYHAINQMEKAERQILLNYALDEVKRLKTNCYTMLMTVREIKDKLRLRRGQIQYQINRDKELIESIIRDVNNF